MNIRAKIIKSFFTKLLLVAMLVQVHFPSQVFCIEADGSSHIETVVFNECGNSFEKNTFSSTLNSISNDQNEHHVTCEGCTDISLDQQVSLKRYETEVNPVEYFDLRDVYLDPYKFNKQNLSSKQNVCLYLELQSRLVLHPLQGLNAIILII